MQRFRVVDEVAVFILVSNRLDLQGVRVHLPLPEPIGAAKLQVVRVGARHLIQPVVHRPSGNGILYTQGQVGDAVLDGDDITPFW